MRYVSGMIEEENAHCLSYVEAQDCRALYHAYSSVIVRLERDSIRRDHVSRDLYHFPKWNCQGNPDPHPLNDSEATTNIYLFPMLIGA